MCERPSRTHPGVGSGAGAHVAWRVVWYGNPRARAAIGAMARGTRHAALLALALLATQADCANLLFDTPLPLSSDGTIDRLSVSTASGSATEAAGFADGDGTAALFASPAGLALSDDAPGLLFIGTADGHSVRTMATSPPYAVSTFAGSAVGAFGDASSNGVGTEALFNHVVGVAADHRGSLFVADAYNCAVRRIFIVNRTVTHFAGTPDSCLLRESVNGSMG